MRPGLAAGPRQRGRSVLNDVPSPNTQAILLLTAPLILGRHKTLQPPLRELRRQPAALEARGRCWRRPTRSGSGTARRPARPGLSSQPGDRALAHARAPGHQPRGCAAVEETPAGTGATGAVRLRHDGLDRGGLPKTTLDRPRALDGSRTLGWRPRHPGDDAIRRPRQVPHRPVHPVASPAARWPGWSSGSGPGLDRPADDAQSTQMGRGLDALLARGARRWPNPEDPEALGSLLDTPPEAGPASGVASLPRGGREDQDPADDAQSTQAPAPTPVARAGFRDATGAARSTPLFPASGSGER